MKPAKRKDYKMDLGLKGKKALVTGGTRGIGGAIVDLLVAEGCDVAFCARDEKQIKTKSDKLNSDTVNVVGSVCDVGDHAALSEWISESVENLGGVDIFIPNVSGGMQTDADPWKAVYDVDLMATVRGCEQVLELMSTGGSIVVISSISGLESFGPPGAYATIKAGLISYSSQLGEAAAVKNVRVNAVSPGPIHVEDGFWGGVEKSSPDMYKAVASRQPLGARLGTPEEVARSVVFLASPAASWVTRTNHVVDGGFTRRIQF